MCIRDRARAAAIVYGQVLSNDEMSNLVDSLFACSTPSYTPVSYTHLDVYKRQMLDPAYANVAFNLQDPNKVSKIVESEYGFHIIQLIEKLSLIHICCCSNLAGAQNREVAGGR